MKVIFDYDEDDNRQKEFVENAMTKYSHLIVADGTQDLIIVIGGDGAMLKALKKFGRTPNPPKLFGIGRGTVNFLMNSPEILDNLEDISLKEITYHSAHHLTISIQQPNGRYYLTDHNAYNDIVLGSTIMGYHTFKINSDDGSFENYVIQGSGICVSTPIGSTAFNSNNNGTIIPLDMPLLSITGIVCNRELNEIFNGNTLEIEFDTRTAMCPFVDGHSRSTMEFGLGIKHGKIKIGKAKRPSAKIGFLNNHEFNKRRIEMLKARRK